MVSDGGSPREEAEQKAQIVLDAAVEAGFEGALLNDRDTVRWLLDGRGRPVDVASTASPYHLLLLPGRRVLFTADIETPRVLAEERPEELGYEVNEYPWHEGVQRGLERVVAGARLGDDVALETPIRGARICLNVRERRRYVQLGRDAGLVFEEVIARLSPAMTEAGVGALLQSEAATLGFLGRVVLVAGERRQLVHRHPLPTDERLGRHALLAASLERDGLHASLTRIVSFGSPPTALVELVRASATVDAAALRASRPGVTDGAVLAAIIAGYVGIGRPEEWRLHHQGGVTGYRPRELIAAPGGSTVLQEGMAVAWNPSITGGAKSEDTALVGVDGPTILTRTESLGEWEVDGLPRPAIVELGR